MYLCEFIITFYNIAMDSTLLTHPQEMDVRRRQQIIAQEGRRDFLTECDRFARISCIATSSGLIAFGAIYLYYYLKGIPTDSIWYSIIFIVMFLASAIWNFYTKYLIKDFYAMEQREYERRLMEQQINNQIQQQERERDANVILDGRPFNNAATSTFSNHVLSNRSFLNSDELITDMQQGETSDNVASFEYPIVKVHGEYVEYIFGPLPAKRPD